MKPFPIVIHFDVIEDVVFGIIPGLESLAVDSLDFKAVIPAFHGGMIVAVTFLAHAANQLVLGQQKPDRHLNNMDCPVLAYLSRYTHRTALSNERIVALERDKVLLRVRADDHGGKRITHINGVDFIGRVLQHVLPPGFKRIRHYGLLSSAVKSQRLALARAALEVPPPVPVALESAEQFKRRVAQQQIERCPCCGEGRLRQWADLLPESVVNLPLLKRLLPAESCGGRRVE
ncbi:transposase [Candidatus Methylospira mobilis]|nr:transposase [Candidatus Methylospira mobilis]WNV04612.1 transposase [Candidatus Methylospira mobilis]